MISFTVSSIPRASLKYYLAMFSLAHRLSKETPLSYVDAFMLRQEARLRYTLRRTGKGTGW